MKRQRARKGAFNYDHFQNDMKLLIAVFDKPNEINMNTHLIKTQNKYTKYITDTKV